jgi:hypothetical protein
VIVSYNNSGAVLVVIAEVYITSITGIPSTVNFTGGRCYGSDRHGLQARA